MKRIALTGPTKQGKSSVFVTGIMVLGGISAPLVQELRILPMAKIFPEHGTDLLRARFVPGRVGVTVRVDGTHYILNEATARDIESHVAKARTVIFEFPLRFDLQAEHAEGIELVDLAGDRIDRVASSVLTSGLEGETIDAAILVGRFGFSDGALPLTVTSMKSFVRPFAKAQHSPLLIVATRADESQLNPELRPEAIEDMVKLRDSIHPGIPILFESPLLVIQGVEGNMSAVTRESLADLARKVEPMHHESALEIGKFLSSQDGGLLEFEKRLLDLLRKIPAARKARALSSRIDDRKAELDKLEGAAREIFGESPKEWESALDRAVQARLSPNPRPIPLLPRWPGPLEWREGETGREVWAFVRRHLSPPWGVPVGARIIQALRSKPRDAADLENRIRPFMRELAYLAAVGETDVPPAELLASLGLEAHGELFALGETAVQAQANPGARARLRQMLRSVSPEKVYVTTATIARNGSERKWLADYEKSRTVARELTELEDELKKVLESME